MFAYAFANGSVQELWTEYEFIPQIRIKAGQFKTTFGLENGIAKPQGAESRQNENNGEGDEENVIFSHGEMGWAISD